MNYALVYIHEKWINKCSWILVCPYSNFSGSVLYMFTCVWASQSQSVTSPEVDGSQRRSVLDVADVSLRLFLLCFRSWTGCVPAACPGDQPRPAVLWREACPGWGVAAPTESRTATVGWVRPLLELYYTNTGFQERFNAMRFKTAAWIFAPVWYLAVSVLMPSLFSFELFLTQHKETGR